MTNSNKGAKIVKRTSRPTRRPFLYQMGNRDKDWAWPKIPCNIFLHSLCDLSIPSTQATYPSLYQMGYRDKAWSVNRLGHVARLHHQPDAVRSFSPTKFAFNVSIQFG